MKVDWKEGPPTEPGHYWVRFANGDITVVNVERVRGVPYTHHAPVTVPDPPDPSPGWYVAFPNDGDDEDWMIIEIDRFGRVFNLCNVSAGVPADYMIGPQIEGDPSTWLKGAR